MKKLETTEPVRRLGWASFLQIVFFVFVALGASASILFASFPIKGMDEIWFMISFGVFAKVFAKGRGRSGWWFFIGLPIGWALIIILKLLRLHWLSHGGG